MTIKKLNIAVSNYATMFSFIFRTFSTF